MRLELKALIKNVMQEITRTKIEEVIAEQRETVFVPEYRARQTEPTILGITLSQYFEWNGVAILETAIAGLEDANFHTEARELEAILNRVNKGTV